jgi:hypothetical protein
MESETIDPRPSGRAIRLLVASAIVGVTFVVGAFALKHAADPDQAVRIASVVAALGTLACAAFGARDNRYPRWAYWSGAALLVIGMLVSPMAAPSSARWIDVVHDSTWMGPWFFILLTAMPASRRGACAAERPLAGWLLVGTALVLAATILVSPRF